MTEINNHYKTRHITGDLIHQTTKQFIGEIDQKPPIFSAIKKAGERFYKKARRGEEIEIEKAYDLVDGDEVRLGDTIFKFKACN